MTENIKNCTYIASIYNRSFSIEEKSAYCIIVLYMYLMVLDFA